ncbi:MAG: GerMN domain-containing protein [Spirochaetia bacterium]
MTRKKSSLGCLFWLALALLVVVIFLLNVNTITNVLDSTGFVDVVRREIGIRQDPEVTRETEEELPPEIEQEEDELQDETEPEEQTRQTPQPEQEPEEQIEEQQEAAPIQQPTEQQRENQEAPTENIRRGTLYFLRVDDSGSITLHPGIRSIRFRDAPLTRTVEALLAGPSPTELNSGLISLVPENTQLHSAWVSENTAFLNFNESFRFNRLGSEGIEAQMKQVIYTATEFANIRQVQILIEGEEVDYLGAEGFFIGEPLSRSDF